MAFTNPDATFALQADRVYRSYNQALEIRDRHGAKEGDTRCVSMNNIAMASNASTATLRLMHWAKKGGDGLLIQALGLAKPEYINFVGEDLLRSSRLFLLLESQFQLETAFRNILLALVLPIPTGFYNVSRDVLAAAGVSDAAVKLRVLNVPALMRNSMHANGIHYGWKGSSTVESVSVKGVEFRFENGKKVECGSWFHIVRSPATRSFTLRVNRPNSVNWWCGKGLASRVNGGSSFFVALLERKDVTPTLRPIAPRGAWGPQQRPVAHTIRRQAPCIGDFDRLPWPW